MARKLLRTRRYKAGYEIRYERLSGEDAGYGEPFVMRSAFTPDNYYIGDPLWAYRLMKRGIKPQPRTPPEPEANGGFGRTCTIGFCDGEQKWYGWSHRAICGFEIGYEIKTEDDLCAGSGWTDEYIAEHPEKDQRLPVGFVAKDLEDCKRMAIAFAEAVG